MLFNSLIFLVFFVSVFLVYWRLPHCPQNYFLLAASLLFYGSWNFELLWLIIFSASVDYFCSLRIVATDDRRVARRFLILSVVANLGLLSYFKYTGFFVDSFVDLAAMLGVSLSRPTIDIILPVGISFYTFQSMSYTIDVYRGGLTPTRRYTDFLLYVSFFPQLVAVPIERGARLLPQVQNPRMRLRLSDRLEATKLIVVGYFQKVAIADSLAPHVDFIFDHTSEAGSLALLFGIYGFAIQIYCDFSGYSKIARGTARLLGFELMRNFEEPYLSRNISEFWRRWHISLSTWARDYVFISLSSLGRTWRRQVDAILLITH